MKRLVSKPTYGNGEYYYEDPFSSSLKIMQEKCTSLLRPSWNKADLEIPVDYQQIFKQQSDLDIIQFEEKYLPQNATDNEIFSKFTPTIPKILTNTDHCRDDPSTLEFSELWEFSPEVLSTKDLQITKCEPFGNLIYEESSPANIFYEEAKQIPSQPLQFDDPLKMNPSPLLPAIPADNFSPQTCLSLGNIKVPLKDIPYPETPSCDYLFDLARQVNDLNIVPDVKVIENKLEDPRSEMNEKQQVAFLVPNTHLEVTKNPNIPEEFSVIPVERTIAELPGFAASSLKLMEAHIYGCLQILKQTNSPLIGDLLKESSPLAELDPKTTRLYLLKLQQEINRTELDSGQNHNEKELKKILPTLLSLHGINKGLDLFLNIDYDIAYGTLANFEKTHETVLEGDYKSLVMQLLRLRPKKLEAWHPKLVELKRIVIRQLGEDKTNRKIWIRLYRHSSLLAERIELLFTDVGIQCEVDTRIGCPESTPFFPNGSYPIIIAEKLSENFPTSLLFLIIHYEWSSTWPMEKHWQSANVTQIAIEINRPVCLEQQSIPDQQTCPVSISTPTRHHDLSPSKEMEVDSSIEDDSDASMESESSFKHNKENSTTYLTQELYLSIQEGTGIQFLNQSCDASQSHIDEEQNMEKVLSQSPNKDSIHVSSPASVMQNNTDKSSSTGSTDFTLPVIVSAHLKNNVELMDAIEADGHLVVYDCDYEFLGYTAKYQPDVLINADTALLIIHEQEKFEETRLRVLTTSLKCTKCWIVVLAPGVICSSKPPLQWHSLAGLVRFYEKKDRKKYETRFHLKLRIAVNYHQVAFIMKDIAEDEITQDIESHLQPLNDDAKLLLHFPQLNAVTASLIAQHFSAKELLSLPVETLCDRIPSLRQRIKIVRYFHEMNSEEHELQVEDVEQNSSFGHLKHDQPWHLETESLGECGSRQLPTPKKRAKLNSDYPEEMGTPFSASQLRDMWCSPSPSRPV
ncbi:uncharacterized protein LOC130687565 [Daphnia carinata]|uniref:uncharacterized protein LOC130687565 n=1 Tax=Daphnia carinata TaxID=120202 RepID=UPI002868A767|nr:uncharacterized protein LOC130687565 [Daphnia carinata]